MALTVIKYPYLPAGREYLYVGLDNPFMQAARQATMSHGCRKHATGAVAVRDNTIIASGSNAGIYVTVCPRVYKGYGTGEGYRYCTDYCEQTGHAEVMVCKNAAAKGVDLNGADVYLYGHWWACQKCWDTMIAAGIRNVYLLKDSEIMFNDQVTAPGELPSVDLGLYVSGPLTHLQNQEIKKLYEQIGALGESMGFSSVVPHRFTDPVANPDVTPEEVYKRDKQHVIDADLMVCYVGETSLGTGMELEIAVKHKTLVILLSEEGVKVSRMVLGSPAVIDHVQFTSFEDALAKLRVVLEKFVKTAKQKNISVKA